MNENIGENMESVPTDTGLSALDGLGDWTGVPSVSDGDLEQIANYDGNGDTNSPNVWTDGYSFDGAMDSSGVNTDNPSDYTETLLLISENQTQILDTLTGINSMLVLVFAFLLFEWTEKKINVTVNRFTGRNRK